MAEVSPQDTRRRLHLRVTEERFITAIQDSGGAMVAVLEFDPPLPKSTLEAKYSQPELFIICGDDRFETNAPRWRWKETAKEIDQRLLWSDEFYEQPVCRKCKYSLSRRSAKPFTLAHVDGSYDGAFGHVGTAGSNTHQLVSDEFLKLLTPQERRRLEFQATIRKGRKQFHELIGPEGPSRVAVRGLKHSGWRCKVCGYRRWGYWLPELQIHEFVAKSSLPRRLPGVFTVGTSPDVELAATAARWRELVGRKGTRGFTSQRLGVVADREVICDPKLPILTTKRK